MRILSLPTRLSTKLTLRSHWRTSGGGQPERVELAPVRRGCRRGCAGSASLICLDQLALIAGPGSSTAEVGG